MTLNAEFYATSKFTKSSNQLSFRSLVTALIISRISRLANSDCSFFKKGWE